MEQRKRGSKLCYLCGQHGADTKEHIPPKGLFPKSPEGNLITVPAHSVCNNKFSEYDEEVRNYIAAVGPASSNPKAKQVWTEKVAKSFKNAPGIKRKMMENMTPVMVVDPKTGKLVRRVAIRIHESIINAQVDRWTRGIYYHHYQEPFPPDKPIIVTYLKDAQISVMPLITQRVIKSDIIIVVPLVFSYFYERVPTDRQYGYTLFLFFNTVVFMGDTGVRR